VKLVDESKISTETPGAIVSVDNDSLSVQCGEGVLEICTLQPESKPKMRVSDYLKGHSLQVGDCFV
jgi:methionyl-tRNA formyltransferase